MGVSWSSRRGGTRLPRAIAERLRRRSAQRKGAGLLSVDGPFRTGVGRGAVSEGLRSVPLMSSGGRSAATLVPFRPPVLSGEGRSWLLPFASKPFPEPSYRDYLAALASLYAANRRAPAPTFATPHGKAS